MADWKNTPRPGGEIKSRVIDEKPCKRCGSTDLKLRQAGDEVWVACENCAHQGTESDCWMGAISNWNVDR